MNPHQKNKIDISSLSADEQRLFRLYGKLPNKKDLLQNKLKERKYFDSGDYALSKAGKASDTGVTTIGTEHPQVENIPHLGGPSPPNSAILPTATISSSTGSPTIDHHYHHLHLNSSHFLPGTLGQRGSIQLNQHGGGGGPSQSPVKESSYLARTASVDEDVEAGDEEGDGAKGGEAAQMSGSPPAIKEALPIRR